MLVAFGRPVIPNQPSKFRTKNWVELNDDSRKFSSCLQLLHYVLNIPSLSIFTFHISHTT